MSSTSVPDLHLEGLAPTLENSNEPRCTLDGNPALLEREREVLNDAIQLLKHARRQELGQITSLTRVIELLRSGGELVASHYDVESACERLSVVIDALAFHAGEIHEHSDTVHGAITLLSEVRQALKSS